MQPRPQRLLDYREYPILVVDDERENLRIFEMAFRRDFAIVTAESGEEGLRLLNEQPIAVIVSDHRMPGMTGVEFLARSREIDPKALRLLVTAYGDAETLGSAVNDGSIYRYVPKPWRPDEMRLALRRAIELYALDREREDLLRELLLLNRIGRCITQELTLEPLLTLLLTAVTGELGYDGVSLFFFEARGERLRHVRSATSGEADLSRELDLTLQRAQAPDFFARLRGAQSQKLSLAERERLEGPIQRLVLEIAADEVLVMPILGKQEVIGALAVDNRRGGRAFHSQDFTMLDGFTTQASIAIENARLVEALRQSRVEVMRADRLGRLGTLAAGLAHEINNPLVAIRTFLSLAPAKRVTDDPEFWESYHQLATREVDRIGGLVATMSRLARGTGATAPREACEAGALARETVLLLQREAQRARVTLRVESAPETPKLVAARDQIHQVLLNLVLNAIQATAPGGEVVIRIAPDEGAEGGVMIDVRDTGVGIQPEDLERIFDPFYTTKDPDQGTGLGLMICHRIVTDHGGAIEVQSRPGEGARFRVRLPAGG